jgi:Cu2+-containing amine oxidase
MSYNLYIIRENNSITYEDIVKLVRTYPELKLELKDEMDISTPAGEVVTVPGNYIVWRKEEFNVWLNYRRGKISSGYTKDDGINKLKEIAYKLEAKVVGEDGEEY